MLPDDALAAICECLISEHVSGVRYAMRLCRATCAQLRERLADVARHLERRRRLEWLPQWTALHRTSADGGTLLAEGAVAEDGATLVGYADDANEPNLDEWYEEHLTRSWAAGTLLPSRGVTSWSVRIDACGSAGRMVLGVCDAGGTCGWGIEPYSGALSRCTRDGRGVVHLLRPAAPPAGCPAFDGATPPRLMATNLRGTAAGSVVEIELDAERGVVAFTVDEGGDSRKHSRSHVAYPRRHELAGFPRHVRLRPWAMLYFRAGDAVTIRGCTERDVE